MAAKRIARLMRGDGLAGRTPRRWRKTTIPAAAARVDLIRRDFRAVASKLNSGGAAVSHRVGRKMLMGK
jgi:putative transposase